jgi:hypothetical protein
MPALIAGIGLSVLPEFILRDALAAGPLERLLPDRSLLSGAPPGGPRPKRVEILGDFLFAKLSRHTKRGPRGAHDHTAAGPQSQAITAWCMTRSMAERSRGRTWCVQSFQSIYSLIIARQPHV